ncbi:MAG: long-chain fatty acid--CoA ligase [Acidimicrobiia bacterium]
MAVAQSPATIAHAAGFATVASRARDRAQQTPGRVAMREKNLGIWQEYTWAQLWERIADAAHGLMALGIEPGDRVSIHAEDRPEWIILDLATVAVRAITVGLYPTNPPAEVEYLLTDSGASVHLVEDQEQADKVTGIDRSALPGLRTIIHVEPRGFRELADDRLMSWEDFLALGRRHRADHPRMLDERMAAAEASDVMTLVYTSGTTGPPKGAMLTNKNAGFCIDTIVLAKGRVEGGPPNQDDLILTYLPLCHVAERIFSTWTSVASGAILNFAESIDTVTANLREVQPTLFFAVPRIWEKIHAGVLIRANDASWLKKRLLHFGFALSRRIGRTKVAHDGNHTFASRILFAVGYVLVFRAIQERIGLRRCRYAGSGAAPIAPEVLEFFIGLGVPVYELYGMTENSAVATANFPGRMKLGTVGEPYAGIGVRIDEQTGEIQTKHDGTFAGYWKRPEQTAEVMTADGWLMTGDVGVWVDGTHIKIVDRIKHIIVTSGGKNVSPSEIENSLKTSPYVREAMVIGDRRKYCTALIGIEYDSVGDWALRRGLPYTTYRDLSEKPEVIELIQGVVDETNKKLSSVEQIKKFRLLRKELDHEDGELTATQKLKRKAVETAFNDLVESMYA